MTMARSPDARLKILEAARQIVETRGAGSLTFDELVGVSGITRGGITYHFPTKSDLLRALIESDMAQWEQAEAAHMPDDCDEDTSRLLGFIGSYAGRDEKQQRLMCGMFSAVTLDPSLLDPFRAELRRRLGTIEWSERDLRLQLLRLAAEGLMWRELFQLYSMPKPVQERLINMMKGLARQWGAERPQELQKGA